MSAQALTDFVNNLQPSVASERIDQQIELITQNESVGSSNDQYQDLHRQYGLDGSGQTIVVIDSGIAFDHAALGGGFGASHKVVGGYDFAENDANPYDDGPVGLHGTHVAGIIGAESDEFVGIAPGSDIVSLRVFDDSGHGELEWVEQALQWVHDNRNSFEHPITTVNLSLGTQWNADTIPDVSQFEDEFAQLEADGMFISVAAGNLFNSYHTPGVSYPAASPFVVPVASHGDDGMISDFSQRNDRVLVAPGESVLSTVPEHVFGGSQENPLLKASGTSQSAPYVAGASALLREAFNESGVQDVDQDLLYQHFRETADVIFDQATGGYYHRINLQRAIETALQNIDPSDDQPPVDEAFFVRDGVLYVNGTNAADQIQFRQGQILEVVVNDRSFTADPNSVSHVMIVGGGGTDSISVDYGNQIGRAVLQANRVDVSRPDFELTARGFEEISLIARQDADRLVVRDSAGDDHVLASYDQITIGGSGFNHQAQGFSKVQLNASQGQDRIEMVGNDGDDRFVAKDGRNVLRNIEGRIVAKGFDHLTIIASAGNDVARLYDTAGTDRFELDANSFRLSNVQAEVTGSGFTKIQAFAGDGYDSVVLKGTTASEQLVFRDSSARLQGEGFTIIASDFEQTVVWGEGGTDSARIYGTAGDDHFYADGFNARFQTQDGQLYSNGFDIVDVFADLAGSDSAHLVGSDFSDSISATNDTTRIQSALGIDITVHGFDRVHVDAGGGYDTTSIVGSEGVDLLKSLEQGIEYQSLQQILRIVEAEGHVFDGQEGFDEVIFSDFDDLDLLAAVGDGATAYRDAQTIQAIDIEFLQAETLPGSTGLYEMDAVDFLFLLDGDWEPN